MFSFKKTSRGLNRGLNSVTVWRWHHKGSTFSSVISRPWVLVELGLEPVTQSCLEVADANPTELKRKHQVEAAYHVPPPKLSGVLTPRDLTLIKFYLWKDLMGERVLEIACSLTPYFLFRERRARVWKWLIDFWKKKEHNVCVQAIIGEGQLNPIISSNIHVKILHTFPLRKKILVERNWPVIYTVARALANIKAIPLPIPRDAPVTRHTFPDNAGSSDVIVQLGDLLHNNGRLELLLYIVLTICLLIS